jgi:hypothetical protein
MCCRSTQHFMPGAHKFYTKAPKICGQRGRNLLLVIPALCHINYAYYPEVRPTTQAGPKSNFDTRQQCLVLHLHVKLCVSVGQRNVPEILYTNHALRNVCNIKKETGTMVAIYQRTTHFRRLRGCSLQEVLRTLQCPQLTTCLKFKQKTTHCASQNAQNMQV